MKHSQQGTWEILGNQWNTSKTDCTLWFGILWSLRPNDVEICWRALLQEKMRHMEESIKQAKGRGREISCSCFVHSVCIMHPYHIIATKRLVVWFSRNNAKFYGICTRYPLGSFTTGWTTLRQSTMAMDAMEHLPFIVGDSPLPWWQWHQRVLKFIAHGENDDQDSNFVNPPPSGGFLKWGFPPVMNFNRMFHS